MRLSRRNLCCAAVLCSFFLLTSCSSHQKTAKHPSLGASNSGIASSEAPCALPSGDVEDVEESTLAEPEQSAKEEIAALDRLGDWKAGAKTMSGAALATGYELSGYDFPVVLNKQVNYYLELFQGKQRNDFARWLARSSRYVPAIEKELIKAGLPRDLAFLAMIESGYNPSAVSCAGAGGLWQFMPATGRQYNLTINSWVDERREPEKATQAAIRYLSRLYRQFNDWHLAVAAYNTGEGKIEQAIKAENTSDFWELAASEGIYLETKRYVPKLIAAIIIARNPAAYGFDNIEFQPAHRYEVVHVPGSTDLAAVASTANTSVKHLRTLNNELLKNHTPPLDKKYALRVPLGCKDLVAANIDKLRLQPAKSTKAYATHVVKKGETLTAPGDVVVDNGAASFVPLSAYLKENQTIDFLEESGIRVLIHTVFTGGQAMKETADGLVSLASHFPTVPLVVWLNRYFGEIATETKKFEEFKVYRENQDKIAALIYIPLKSQQTFGKDLEELFSRHQTFAAALASDALPVMTKQRLKIFWNEVSQAIDMTGIIDSVPDGITD